MALPKRNLCGVAERFAFIALHCGEELACFSSKFVFFVGYIIYFIQTGLVMFWISLPFISFEDCKKQISLVLYQSCVFAHHSKLKTISGTISQIQPDLFCLFSIIVIVWHSIYFAIFQLSPKCC